MIEYRCPIDGKLAFKAEAPVGVRIETFCQRCKSNGRSPSIVAVPKAGAVFLRTCKCTRCNRTQTITTPVDEPGYCIVCGTQSLTIIEEIGLPAEAPSKVLEPVRVR